MSAKVNSSLNKLPASLRSAILDHTHSDVIKNITFFQERELEFRYSCLGLLRRIKLSARETIYKEGDPAEEVYFIYSGSVALQTKEYKVFTVYRKGALFGDNDIIYRSTRDSTAVAKEECVLFVLSRFEFTKLLDEFPEEG